MSIYLTSEPVPWMNLHNMSALPRKTFDSLYWSSRNIPDPHSAQSRRGGMEPKHPPCEHITIPHMALTLALEGP